MAETINPQPNAEVVANHAKLPNGFYDVTLNRKVEVADHLYLPGPRFKHRVDKATLDAMGDAVDHAEPTSD